MIRLIVPSVIALLLIATAAPAQMRGMGFNPYARGPNFRPQSPVYLPSPPPTNVNRTKNSGVTRNIQSGVTFSFQPLSDGGYQWSMNKNLQAAINRNLASTYAATYPAYDWNRPAYAPQHYAAQFPGGGFRMGFQPGWNGGMRPSMGMGMGMRTGGSPFSNWGNNYSWSPYRQTSFSNSVYGPSWGAQPVGQFNYFGGQ